MSHPDAMPAPVALPVRDDAASAAQIQALLGASGASGTSPAAENERGSSPINPDALLRPPSASYSPSRPPTSAEIDAVIAAAIANAPPPPPPQPDYSSDTMTRSVTPLMTNLLPSAVGMDGRVNLFVGNLPYRVRWQDLKDLFRKAGTVLRADVSLGPDNRSRGYGTVLMGSREDAARAIDRYNGYTWQTRTLEVRPDRLPPEYEAQTHPPPHHNVPSRNGPYGFHNLPGGGGSHSPYPISGHLTPAGGGGGGGGPWVPGQIPNQRSPFGLPAAPGGSHGMLGVPGAPPMSINGSSPIPSAQSPGQIYGTLPIPLSVQNTGGQPYPQLAASPLAGSLTAGTAGATAGPASTQIAPSSHADSARRGSLAPFANSVSPDMVPRSTSPAAGVSRPTSSAAKVQAQPQSNGSPSKDAQLGRVPPPGSLGPLPSSLLGQSTTSSEVTSAGESLSISPPIEPAGSANGQSAPAMPGLEGLAHHGMGLGPPNTLHDRLPLSMQWQDLKDLLRPAGTIIRADVATDGNGRPRGFGTALFASEVDASRAVGMFNDRDIGGFRIRAHLERDSHPERVQRSQSDAQNMSPSKFTSPDRQANRAGGRDEQMVPPIDTSTPVAQSRTSAVPASGGDTSPITKLPWSLNTSLHSHQTPGRPNFRQSHHPGPISMPAFPPLDHGNPMSPQARGLPPMTPSMPGFVFNAYPETPPIHPHFMSPGIGLGPFSPGIPVTSPTAFQYNPFLNAAPGAPVNRYPQAGSAQLGTPTTMAFPNPVNGGQGPIHGYAGPPGQPNISQTLDYFPNMLNQQQQQQMQQQQMQVMQPPDSPTPRIPRPPPSVSPLNAKDRLAPAAPVPVLGGGGGKPTSSESLATLTSALEINGDEDDSATANGKATPESPSVKAQLQRSSSNSNTNAKRQGNGQGLGVPSTTTSTGGGGRASLDESRTFAASLLGDGVNGAERRASFSAAPGSGR